MLMEEASNLAALLRAVAKGNSVDFEQAFSLMDHASENGDPSAAANLAVLHAAGVLQPPAWETALDLLALAAQRGDRFAQSQLGLLGGHGDCAHVADWVRYRASIDLASWFTLPPKTPLAERPRLRALRGFIEPQICRWWIERARPKLVRARVYSPKDASPALDPMRNNSEALFDLADQDVITLLTRQRIAAAIQMPPAVMELGRVLHYAPGEQFGAHYDFIDPIEPMFAAELSRLGQRLVTFLIYLNDDYAGGQTSFPLLNIDHRGVTGDALYFANVDLANKPEPRSLHAGLPLVSGNKWILSQWFRDRVPKPG